MVIASISASVMQNVGELSLGGTGGLADSSWPMFRQNVRHTGLSTYDTSSNPGKLKWSFTTGGNVESSPVVGSDGTIYVGTIGDKKLYAINPEGTEKWNFTTSGSIHSSPAIGFYGTIYVGSADNQLYAINPDGTEKWNFSTGYTIGSSPTIDSDDTIYVGSTDHKFYAINPDGTEKWSYTTGYRVWSSPAVGSDGTVYIGSQDNKLYAFNPDGTVKWNFPTGLWVDSSPAIGSDGTIYVGSRDDNLYAISPDGTEKWNFMTGGNVDSSPAIGSDSTIYVGSWDGKLYAINPDGTEKWSFSTGYYVSSSPAIGYDGTIYVGSQDNKLYAINPDGTEKWNFTTGSPVHSSPAIDSEGTIYFGSTDYKLYALGTPTQGQPPTANAGPDQTVNEGDVVQFDGTGSEGSGAHDYWDSFIFGADSFITSAPSDTILATFDYYGTVYPALVATDYGNGRAVYAEGSTFSQLANLADPGNVHHQLFLNSVKWATKDKDPATSNILVVWGHRELLTYGTAVPGVEDSNVTRALEDEGYYVSTSHDVPTSLADYDAVIIPGIGWSWGGWVNPNLWSGPGGTNTAHKPTAAEVTTLLSFIQNGGGLVASVEYEYGADWLQDVGNPMGVYFAAITWETPFTAYRIVEHPIFLKWDGEPVEIISYEWDFESDGVYDYQETPTNAPDGAFDGKTTHIYGDDGVYTVTLRVTDDVGASDTDTCKVTVKNVEPTIGAITGEGVAGVSQYVIEEWVARYNSPGNMYESASDVTVDSYGNVYVTGFSRYNFPDDDYVTVKYDANGIEQWVARYNGPGNSCDDATAITVDMSGNVYVTGWSEGIGTDYDFCTIKYNSSGNELWIARYNGPISGKDGASDIVIDSSGNVYVTGHSTGGGTSDDFTTIAYDSLGNELWIARYNGPQNGSDISGFIEIDILGNIYVTGFSMCNGTYLDYITIKYDTNGNQLWLARYNGPANNEDRTLDITVDSTRNVYVTGASEGIGTELDFATIKYDSNGNELWVARYDGPGNGGDDGRAITVDSMGNIYVTGYSEGIDTGHDYTTIKYDSNGNELWTTRYNGPGNGKDHAYDIAIDPFGNVYVTGLSWGGWLNENGTLNDYATIAYDSYGNEIWIARYNGPGESDWAYALTTDPSGNVYVTGGSLGNGTWYDYATIKYSYSPQYEYNEYDEGSSTIFTANVSDPGSDDLTFTWDWGDGTPDSVTTYYNNGMSPEPAYDPATNEVKSPWGTYPFNVTDNVSHIYGDNGIYTITLTVEDDDGEVATHTMTVTVQNVAPTINSITAPSGNEGSPITFTSTATDLGSDDLTFTWDWGDGTPSTVTTHHNDGLNPDPNPSPWGIYPFNVTDSVQHTYGDNGVYTIVLTVEDDDFGVTTINTTFVVNNVAPTVTLLSAPSGDEGSSLTFEAEASDPGSDDLMFSWEFEYGPTIGNTYYNDGSNPDPSQSPLGTYPFNASDTITHTYGDNYNYTLILTVTDDDGGTAFYTTTISVNNVAPSIIGIAIPISIYEGSSVTYGAVAHDFGSDDITFEWDFGDSTSIITNTYYNNGTAPDSYPSPEGTYPFYATDSLNHTYGDNGVYYAKLTVTDDDGGATIYNLTTYVSNVAPVVNVLPDITIDEGGTVSFIGHATDPGSDDLSFTWSWDYAGFNDTVNTYLNNPPNSDPYPSPEINPRNLTDLACQVYGDNGVFTITLTVTDDDGGTTTVTTTVTVNNLAPIIVNIEAYMRVNFTLRVAGEKWHSVNITLYENNTEIWNAEVMRKPGSPDEQAASLTDYKMKLGSTYSAVVDYLPNNPMENGNVWGGNPVWIDLEFQDGTTKRLHHTFNVKQSYWNSDHWNHIDPWEVNLTATLYKHIIFKASATDPGSDDLTFNWSFGSTTTYYNNGLNPDLYPSPDGIFPFSATDITTYTYSGLGTITLTVTDDDGGICTATIDIG